MNKALITMCGLTCVGKSTLSNKLSASLGIKRISTDDVRIKLPKEATEILNGNPMLRYVVYFHTLEIAQNILLKGQSVIIDGTFSGAYFVAAKTGASVYVIECYCNNYNIIHQRFEKRKNNPIFKEWASIESYHKKFLDFEPLDREILPDGRPVPIMRYDSEKNIAEVVYTDGSETIQNILEAINQPGRVKV